MPPLPTLVERVSNSHFAYYISRFFPKDKVQKITLSAATTCPNRDGSRGVGGCTYCNNQAFSPSFAQRHLPVEEQLARGIEFFRHKYPLMRYLAYFQAYTATYGETRELLKRFRAALDYPGVVGLVLATRPDTLPPDMLEALTEIAQEHFLLVELGIESTLDSTLEHINRGHTFSQSVDAVHALAQRGIHVGGHLILGLPGESREDMLAHAERLNRLPIEILKLHQLQIVRHTPMAEEWLRYPERFHLFSPEEYASLALDFLEQLRSDIVVDRFVSQSPAELLLAPKWEMKNYAFQHLLLSQAKARCETAGESPSEKL